MTYSVKEIFYTLQGEGANSGSPAVFCRFAGCNLWSGREKDRSKAICQFCDTEFVGVDGTGGGKFATSAELAERILSHWPASSPSGQFVVLTGGEPLLQVDAELIDHLHVRGFRIAVETNGTITPPVGIDWICVSPKAGAPLVVKRGNELKMVYPQSGLSPEDLEDLEFENWFLQPMDGVFARSNTEAAIERCLQNPRWRLSIQVHKVIGIR